VLTSASCLLSQPAFPACLLASRSLSVASLATSLSHPRKLICKFDFSHQAPAFAGTAVREGEFVEVSNKDYAGKWYVDLVITRRL
jgi:hypothetical protein